MVLHALIAAAALAGSDAWLIQMEHQKWENWNAGHAPADLKPLFAPGAVNIGYFEKGPARTEVDAQTIDAVDKAMRAAAPDGLPPGAVTLSDFKVLRLGKAGAIVTYLIHDRVGPLGDGFVTSVWENRGGTWKTVFYQATAGASRSRSP